MRTLIHDTFGDPAEVITVREVEDPRPAAGELLLRTVLAPIHHHDLWTIRGSYGVKPELPARPGSEAVAIIEELGEGVEGFGADLGRAASEPPVGGQQVGSKLDALIVSAQGLGQGVGQGGLANAGQIFDQQMPTGQQTGE